MKLLLILSLFYIFSLVALFIMQRTLIYFPDKSRPIPLPGVEVIRTTAQDGQKLEAWYFAAKSPEKPVIVFFHGNAGHYGHRIYKAQSYLKAGYGVVLAEYRGYGGNSGSISEQGFYHDGRAYMDWLLNEKKVKPGQMILYGESIGSGVAVQMATEYNVRALILEAPFSSLLELAARRYFFIPVKYLLKDRFMSIEKIGTINVPLLVMHGKKDRVIPFSLSQKLFESAKEPKTFVDFPQGEHNNLYDFGASQHVLDFLVGVQSNNDHNDE